MKIFCNRLSLAFLVLSLLPALARADQATNTFRTGNFPFFEYAKRYNVWEYTPLDQGGRQIQLLLVGSESDADMVRAVRSPGFFKPWGEPISWDSLEKTAVEEDSWLNRLYFLPSFAREYYLTGDKAYLADMMKWVRKWRDENPVPPDLKAYFATKHYNWRDMQVAWRVYNLSWCYFLAQDGLTPAEKQELHDLLAVHARVLYAYFGDQPLIENNHQSHGATALLYAALLFPDLPDAAGMKARAFEILNHHLDKAFYDDGNSVELVPGYYPFFTSIFRDADLLCRANGVTPPARCEERLRQFQTFINTVRQPDGTMPPINDSTESSSAAPLEILAGLPGMAALPAAGSHWFSASHQAVMRDPEPAVPAYVFLDAGPQIAAHWHGGKLGFHLWFWNRPLLVDSGVSDYDDPLKKPWYATPDAHNTLLVDGQGDLYPYSDQARHTKLKDAGSRMTQWESNAQYDWAVMRTTAFEQRTPPVTWTRHFILLKGRAALVVDQLESTGPHDYTWLFHFLPCAPLVDPAEKSVFTALAEHNLRLLPAAGVDSLEVTNGIINQRSQNLTDPVAKYHTHGGTLTQTFLLEPVAGASVPDTRVTQTVKGDSVVIEVADKAGTEEVTLTRGADGKYLLTCGQRAQ